MPLLKLVQMAALADNHLVELLHQALQLGDVRFQAHEAFVKNRVRPGPIVWWFRLCAHALSVRQVPVEDQREQPVAAGAGAGRKSGVTAQAG